MPLKDQTGDRVLQLAGALDIAGAGSLRETLLDSLVRQPELVLDLSRVEDCDAAALQLLFAAQKSAARGRQDFRVACWSDAVAETARVLGLSLDALTGRKVSDAV